MAYGIKETKDIVELMLSVTGGFAQSLKDDGKLTLMDIQHFSNALFMLPDAFSGITNVPLELGELDQSELEELRELVISKMPDVGDKWESVAVHSILAAWNIYEVVKAFGKE